jgi:purine nucleoside phosphorylase
MKIPCLTNWAVGLSPAVLSHDDVSTVGNESAGQLLEVLLRAFPQI